MTDSTRDIAARLDGLRSLVERIANTTAARSDIEFFALCLRSSFVKTFEFIDFVSRQEADNSLFFVSTLRGITEDYIWLRYLSSLPRADRVFICRATMTDSYFARAQQQHRFFQTFRPFQPVLGPPTKEHDSARLRSFWRANGWPKLNRRMPPTREIAMRSDQGILEVVYDFIYRLTSSTVHFDPPTLMRQGWGELPQVTFSVRNMGPYYHAICMIYGTYIFCLYCESFERQISINQEEQTTLADLRKHLLDTFRWPEMVTFEEMNLPVPEPPFWPTALVKGVHDIILQNGFLAGASEIVRLGTKAKG